MTTTISDGASQLLNASPAKRFNESIWWNQQEESLSQVVSGVYDHSNVIDDAIQDENRNPYVRDPGAQTLGIKEGRSLSRYSGGSCLTMQHNPSRAHHLRVQATFGISDC